MMHGPIHKDNYENLVVKSVGLNLFSFVGSSSSSIVDESSFGCVVILSPYLTLNSVISSLIVGTFRSICMTLLVTHTTEHLVVFWATKCRRLYVHRMFKL